MLRYIIERDIPEIGSSSHDELREAAKKSNLVLNEMKAERKNIQWEHSYFTDDKIFCIYLADNTDVINEHAERSGFPVTKISRVTHVVDPTTAES
jgi:hypothetical protein